MLQTVRHESLRPPILFEYTRRKKVSQQKENVEVMDDACDVEREVVGNT